MLHTDSARNRLIGIGMISLMYVLFSVLDVSAKWLVGAMPVIMVVWLRFAVHALLAGAVLLPLQGLAVLRTRYWRWHLLRGVMFVVMTALNFWALQHLQLTTTTSIFFTVPIIVAVASALMLGERIDAGRWAAIVAGFAGVLVVVRPGSMEFHPAMIASIGNAVLYSSFMLMTRRLAAYESPLTIQYMPALIATVGLAPFALAAWEWPEGWREWAVVCLLGVLGAAGHYLLALAHRYATSAVLAPFLYQQILYAAVLGYLLFGDVPSPAVWLGAAIVIASGLYLFARERARR